MRLDKFGVKQFLTQKREKKACKKRNRRRIRQLSRKRALIHKSVKAGFFGTTSTIARMLSSRATSELYLPQTSLFLDVPKNFSMLAAPEDTISFICSFAATHLHHRLSDVFVNFEKVVNQDLGAHALLDTLVDEIVAQTSFQNARMGWKGNFPKDSALRRFIQAMGIIRQLRLTHKYLKQTEAQKIHLFERRCRHYVRGMKPVNPEDKSAQANAAERFIHHVNSCLAKEGRTLTELGRLQLCNYVAEVIDNAENHAGIVDWTIQGYVDMAMDEPQCEIVIFNFGKSISMTLDEMPSHSYTMDQIQKYLDLHGRNGWLGSKWRREDLLTLIALQGSVSSKNETKCSTRGQGTADLIEFFQQLNDERLIAKCQPASMYIISGGTRVLFDPKYRLIRGEDGRRVIAFNDQNDLNLPPDVSCVMPLKRSCHLPGTMIGIKFTIQSDILIKIEDSENKE